MMNELRFALYAIKKNIQNSAELRTSFLTNIVGMMVNNTAFILLWVFFVQSVGVINGWTPADIVALQGFIALCFGIVFSSANGMRMVADAVVSGAFDRFMLSPKSLLVRVATASFGVAAIGDIIFGIACLVLYGFLIHANVYQLLFIGVLVIITTVVFLSAAIAVASASFLFTDSRSVTRGLFEFFLTPSMFHGGAFQGVLRFFFTFLVPSLLIGALPVEIVRDGDVKKLLLVSVLALAWFFIAILLFGRGVQKYESANFMTFGS
ncbi:MAG: ABC-2 family transporter protein [bacterium]|nr:ABC-2 family transporter protein [bacterium]